MSYVLAFDSLSKYSFSELFVAYVVHRSLIQSKFLYKFTVCLDFFYSNTVGCVFLGN
jgi:hypothetical protein